jgi:hypothetical protein
VIQTTRVSDEEQVIVVTRLAHTSGEWIEGELAVPVSKADAQGYGSALTYARRYGLCAITGIAPEDDDGNAAAAAKPAKIGMSAKDVAVETFDAMNAAEQDWCRKQANTLIDLHAAESDMFAWWQRDHAHISKDEELAIWSLLPSNVRSAFKKQKLAALSKPLAEALGSQP